MRKLSVIFSSHLGDEYDQNFINHLKQTAGVDIHIERIINNGQFSLSEAYNKGWTKLDELGIGKEIIIFCHQDITFDTKNWGVKILNHFKKNDYQIIGVAGGKKIGKSGCWWIGDDGQMDHNNMIGIVNHDNSIRTWESKYCNPFLGIKPVSVLDGLFIAVDGNETHHRFDERFQGFHYYDLSFVFSNVLEGLNAGVITDIRITHKSIGQTNQQWEDNRKKFIEIYKNELPFDINEYL
jgi:hypothetical protein